MTKAQKILDNNYVFSAVVFWLFAVIVVQMWPASYWFNVNSVKVASAKEGEQVPMLVDRSINTPFLGTWNVTVRKWGSNGWVTYCTATDTSKYEIGAELPDKLTLEWWSAGKCSFLTEGRYVINTVWVIDPLVPVLPKKIVENTSDIFLITSDK